MKSKSITTIFLCLICHFLTAQYSPIGTWKTIDDEDGEAASLIEISEKNNRLHGKVVKLLKEDPDSICEKCKGKKKNKKIVGMEIMWNMKKDGDKNEWKGGKIMDPKNGKEYKCKLKIEENNTLEVRGYLGFSLLGRTQKWYRVNKQIK